MPKSEAINIDCIEAMKQLPDNYYALGFADPPYAINMSNISKIGKRRKSKCYTNYLPSNWDKNRPTSEFWYQFNRVTVEQIVFGANYFSQFLGASKGWFFWNKGQPADISYAMGEFIYSSFDVPAQMLNFYVASYKNNVSNNPRLVKNMKIHPAQKPIELYRYFINRFCKPGDHIVDTHLGSGSSRIAAHQLGIDFTGYEIDADILAASQTRFDTEINGIIVLKDKVLTQKKIAF